MPRQACYPHAGSGLHRRQTVEPSDKAPRFSCSRPTSANRDIGLPLATFYAARSGTAPPLLWPTFSPAHTPPAGGTWQPGSSCCARRHLRRGGSSIFPSNRKMLGKRPRLCGWRDAAGAEQSCLILGMIMVPFASSGGPDLGPRTVPLQQAWVTSSGNIDCLVHVPIIARRFR